MGEDCVNKFYKKCQESIKTKHSEDIGWIAVKRKTHIIVYSLFGTLLTAFFQSFFSSLDNQYLIIQAIFLLCLNFSAYLYVLRKENKMNKKIELLKADYSTVSKKKGFEQLSLLYNEKIKINEFSKACSFIESDKDNIFLLKYKIEFFSKNVWKNIESMTFKELEEYPFYSNKESELFLSVYDSIVTECIKKYRDNIEKLDITERRYLLDIEDIFYREIEVSDDNAEFFDVCEELSLFLQEKCLLKNDNEIHIT